MSLSKSLLIIITRLLSTYYVLGTVLGLLSTRNRVKHLSCIKPPEGPSVRVCFPTFRRRDLWQAERGEATCPRPEFARSPRLQARPSPGSPVDLSVQPAPGLPGVGSHTWPTRPQVLIAI